MPPGLTFLNTKEATTGGGEILQTTLFFDDDEREDLAMMGLISDLGGHEPSYTDDLFAPFYPDPSQRVLAIDFISYDGVAVMKEETLLSLVQERKGEVLRWGEWGELVTWVLPGRHPDGLWVSGPRLRCVYSTDSGEPLMETYDFSARGPSRQTERVGVGEIQRFAPSVTQNLPVDEIYDIIAAYGCHDSTTFALVNLPPLKLDPKLTIIFYVSIP
jgi:hypothetical protein